MKIYSKTGDAGETGLLGGPRVPKDDLRIEACGAIDELNAAIGMARSAAGAGELDDCLAAIQCDLFCVGAQLSAVDPVRQGTSFITPDHAVALERRIDEFEARLSPLRNFVLPSGTSVAAALHLARAICRRGERRVVSLQRGTERKIAPELIVYVNRLSDLLFVMARYANQSLGVAESQWRQPK
jgi:cob(I)alamin adenosyltransferase